MKRPYQSRNPNAGVTTYEIAGDAIILEFSDARYRYVYNSERPGKEHVNVMMRLAKQGVGLSTYINQHVRENYSKKISLS